MLIPGSFPDELLFSRLIRHFIQSGITSTDYLEWMYGTRKVSIHPVLTCDLKNISRFAKENAQTLFYQQTLAPLFLTFMPNKSAALKKLMASGGSSKAIRICQYHQFNQSAGLSLKYCSRCAKHDIQTYGVAYWHREHQIPGVGVCSTHGILLAVEYLPERQRLSESLLPVVNEDKRAGSTTDTRFSQYSKDVLNHFSQPDRKLNLTVYKNELQKQGYITNYGRVRRKKLVGDFFEFAKQFTATDSIFLPKNEEDYKYFSFLLSGSINQHPTKHLLLEFWLFRDLEKLLSAKKEKRKKAKVKIAKVHKTIKVVKKIQVPDKPVKITKAIKQQIYTLALRGFHRSAIARQFGISAGSVEQEISNHPGMVEHRKRCKFESRRRRYRLQITRFRQSNPNALRKDVRKAHDKAYIWLYHYDRPWLEQALPKATKPKPKGRVDWTQRDNELADRVRVLMVAHKGQLSRSKLDKLLGGHGWMIKQQNKLPKAMQVYWDLSK
ncbi:TnsD family Tn7-like transposition protein [Endozoicomonas ascidiicola]|uniref:TnsD family Tn7-like transposition protein n=1 Tax=Endozoicomonas ascidiicola TaxID=1698521 RepID=UPI000833F88C|nr:TnsD family Tn7-like transposition protein [Endozoicomonas ascidiicola]